MGVPALGLVGLGILVEEELELVADGRWDWALLGAKAASSGAPRLMDVLDGVSGAPTDRPLGSAAVGRLPRRCS